MIAEDLISAARAMLGTPFHHQGRAPGVGLDCAGLLVVACQQQGVACEDMGGYGRQPRDGMLESMLDRQPCLERVPLEPLQAGDVLLMRFRTEPQHLALFAGATVIHAYESAGGVVEHVLDDAWRRRIVRVYRFVEAGA